MMRSVRIGLLLGLAAVQLACAFKPLGSVNHDEEFAAARPVKKYIPPRENGAIYQPGMAVGLFDRVTARRIGDIVTIILKENTNASASSSTSASKDQKVEMDGPTLAGQAVEKDGVPVLENKVDAGREFNGQGTSAQSSTFSGHITVTVAEVLANGNLVVRGQKLMLFNQSQEYIRITGTIRPADIRPDNTIDSYRVADVKLAYSGDGVLGDANSMGPLARFFQSNVWPY